MNFSIQQRLSMMTSPSLLRVSQCIVLYGRYAGRQVPSLSSKIHLHKKNDFNIIILYYTFLYMCFQFGISQICTTLLCRTTLPTQFVQNGKHNNSNTQWQKPWLVYDSSHIVPFSYSVSYMIGRNVWIAHDKIVIGIPSLPLIPIECSWIGIFVHYRVRIVRSVVNVVTIAIQRFARNVRGGNGWHPPLAESPQEIPFGKGAASVLFLIYNEIK